MKKAFILTLVFLCSAAMAVAQDLIVKTDAVRVEAKVTEITPEEVRYKRFSNPDGPTYVLPVGQVGYILYPNGEKDVFNRIQDTAAETAASGAVASGTTIPETAAIPVPAVSAGASVSAPAEMPQTPAGTLQQTATTPATPQQAAAPATPQQAAASATPTVSDIAPEVLAAAIEAQRTYAIGDYYENGPVRGVVCELSDDKKHGLILSLDEVWLPWSTISKQQLQAVGASNADNGEANMQAVERYIAQHNLSWADFPAFEWCRSQGEGWYLPSIDELLHICANYNGGQRIKFNRDARNRFNDTMREHGGKRMDRLAYYFSSTERDARKAICSHVDLEPPFAADISKNTRFLVRAVHRF